MFAGAFGNSGQVCAAIKRVYVHENDHDALVEHLSAEAKQVIVGNGMNPTTTHGPLNNQAQLDIVRMYVDDARSRGANVVVGGYQVGHPNGYGYAPTIVTNIDSTYKLVREEQFGPALPIIKYKTLADAVEQAVSCYLLFVCLFFWLFVVVVCSRFVFLFSCCICVDEKLTFFFVFLLCFNPFRTQNDSSVGLGGSVWGHDTKEASKIASMLQSGTAWVNQHKVMTPNTVSDIVLVVCFFLLSSISHSILLFKFKKNI